ncbi:MAG TPA: FRG domain-containing protein [Gemmatimonadales bacterium]|nr:FRG domain-containing protein [Gemmatimonadales bacterium]
MAVATITVSTLGQLVDQVTPAAPDPATGRRRDTGVYRGAADARWPLLTSLDRLGGVNPPHAKAGLEEHILRNFIRYSRPHLPTGAANEWELLVQAQHHGLPTRLLDWTYSPLVAAHFATLAHQPGGDAAVWRLDWQQLHRRFGFPPLALLIEDLESLFGGDKPFTPLELFQGSHGSEVFACMIQPPSLGDRIAVQSATFTICSDKRQSFDAFLEQHGLGGALTRFVIPEADVPRLRDQLDLVGVDERRLFPDLDGVADQLRRYYS